MRRLSRPMRSPARTTIIRRKTPALHEMFYSTWMMPDHPNVSCCNKQDCYPTEAR